VLAANVIHDPQPEPDRQTRVTAADHHRVPDRLHLLGVVLGQQRGDPRLELRGQLGGVLVAVGLGQRGEARQVGEQEGRDGQPAPPSGRRS
jgi:hypothetical protein